MKHPLLKGRPGTGQPDEWGLTATPIVMQNVQTGQFRTDLAHNTIKAQ